jgi:hypothetical protein
MRVTFNEAKFQYETLSKVWFDSVEKLPFPGASLRVITTGLSEGRTSKSTVGDEHQFSNINLSGPLEPLLFDMVPREIARLVLAVLLGPNVPRWAEDGLAHTAMSAEFQAGLDAAVRKLLVAGKGRRLKGFFATAEFPAEQPERDAFATQATSIVRFLYDQGNAKRELAANSRLPNAIRPLIPDGDAAKEVIRFVRLGMKGDWAAAAKEVYGFESLNEMEDLWLRWLWSDAARVPPVNLGK